MHCVSEARLDQTPEPPLATRTSLCSLLSADFRKNECPCPLAAVAVCPSAPVPALMVIANLRAARRRLTVSLRTGPLRDEAGGLKTTWAWRPARRGAPTALLLFLPVLPVLLGLCQSASLLPAFSASGETSPASRAPRTPQQAMHCSGSRLLRRASPSPLNTDLVYTRVGDFLTYSLPFHLLYH